MSKRDIVCTGLLLLALSGCSSPPPDLVKAPRGPVDDPLPAAAYPQIILLDDLHTKLVGSKLVIDKPTDTRPMRIRPTLRSIADKDVSVQYRFAFLGTDGAPVSDDPSWQAITFTPRTERTLEQTAPNFKAVDWKLEVREYQ